MSGALYLPWDAHYHCFAHFMDGQSEALKKRTGQVQDCGIKRSLDNF